MFQRVTYVLLTLLLISCTGKNPEERSASNSSGFLADAAPKRNPIDTTIIKGLDFLPQVGRLNLVYHLHGHSWLEPMYWTLAIMIDNDTLLCQSDSSSYFDWQLEEASSPEERDSILSNKRTCLSNGLVDLDLEVVKPDDRRRGEFKQISLREFAAYYSSIGYSKDRIAGIHKSFWDYYTAKDIVLIGLPNPNPPNELVYVFEPDTRKIVPFYTP